MKLIFSKFISDEAGEIAMEYGLIAALIAVVSIGGATTLGSEIQATFITISSQMGNSMDTVIEWARDGWERPVE